MNQRLKQILSALFLPLSIGLLSALLTGSAMMTFRLMEKPPLSPPGWLFPVVWTVLYLLMGTASFLVFSSPTATSEDIRQALFSYGLQLFFNFFWSLLFFGMKAYLPAFLWLCVLLFLILLTTLQFYRIDKRAAYLMIPYILWVTFAGYLNLTIYLLN